MTAAPDGVEGPGLPSWSELLSEAETILGSTVEARRIAARAGDFSWAELTVAGDDLAPARTAEWFRAMVRRRLKGEPLQYVIGVWGFRQLDLLVDPRVLIPRPETEAVVEVALDELRRRPTVRGSGAPVVVDLGTGSGAIALSIAAEAPGARVWATDVSADALAVAGANLAGTGSAVAPRVTLCQGGWFHALPGQLAGMVDLIVANPPYVAAGETLPAQVVDWEPYGALFSGPSGFEAVAEIVTGAPEWLVAGGCLVVEIAPGQAAEAAAAASRAGFVDIDVRADLAGRARVLVGRKEQ